MENRLLRKEYPGCSLLKYRSLLEKMEEKQLTINDKAPVYVMGYFRSGPAQTHKSENLHFAYSRDGLHWTALNNNQPVFISNLGEGILRDPFIAKGPDGYFHMVFTIRPKGKSIGYARSRDLIHWEDERMLEVMNGVENVQNCWAPEFTYDAKDESYLIYWASSIGDDLSNSKHFSVRTRDWKSFTPAQEFFNPGFQTIDASLIEWNGKSYMAVKDESQVYDASRKRPSHNILAVADQLDGPYEIIEGISTPDYTEGPEFLQLKDGKILLIYDYWAYGKFGVMETDDMENWRELRPDEFEFPFQARHCTFFEITEEEFSSILHRYGLEARYPTPTFSKVRLAEEDYQGFLHDPFYSKTISMWIRANSIHGTQVLFQEGNDENGLTLRLQDKHIQAVVCSGGKKAHISSPVIEAQQRYHVSVVFQKGTFYLFLDSERVAEVHADFRYVERHCSPAGFGGRFEKDGFGDSDGEALFDGVIQGVKIFNIALDDKDIKLIK